MKRFKVIYLLTSFPKDCKVILKQGKFQLFTSFIERFAILLYKNYPVRVHFKSSIFNLASCSAFCVFYFIPSELCHCNHVLIYFKDSYLFKLLLRVRKVMYRAVQDSELRLHIKS